MVISTVVGAARQADEGAEPGAHLLDPRGEGEGVVQHAAEPAVIAALQERGLRHGHGAGHS